MLWQQDVVWDVTSPAACHPFGVGVRSRIGRRDVPVLMPVPVKERLGAVPPAAPFGGQGCQGVPRTQPGQMLCSALQYVPENTVSCFGWCKPYRRKGLGLTQITNESGRKEISDLCFHVY